MIYILWSVVMVKEGIYRFFSLAELNANVWHIGIIYALEAFMRNQNQGAWSQSPTTSTTISVQKKANKQVVLTNVY